MLLKTWSGSYVEHTRWRRWLLGWTRYLFRRAFPFLPFSLLLCAVTVQGAGYQIGIPRGLYMYRSPGVTNFASATSQAINLAATNTPVWVLTNGPAHNITFVLT